LGADPLRYAVLADIHGNFHALDAVLRAIKDEGVETIVCVGDVAGYAAMPRECLQAIRELAACVVAGNHDFGVVGRVDLLYFNADARDAIEWTKDQLAEDEQRYLGTLPLVAQFQNACLVHSTPYFPEYFSYIQTLYDASLAFKAMERPLGFVGHSHVPIAFTDTDPIDDFILAEFDIPQDQKMIVNVGSVGQPRDMDHRACYVVVDQEQRKVFMRRVDYNVDAAAEAILKAGLPATNAQRLFLGR